ncbi:hypothetical protein [Hydrogenophaga atypica]
MSTAALDAETYKSTLNLLAEVADYLSRMPVNHMTMAMHRKLTDHLASPQVLAMKAHSDWTADHEARAALVRSGLQLTGSVWGDNSDGAPLIMANLVYPELRLESPFCASEDIAAQKKEDAWMDIGKAIAKGVTLRLGPQPEMPSRGTRRPAEHRRAPA